MSTTRSDTIVTYLSDYVQNTIFLDGQPLRFDGLPFMPPILDCSAERKMMMTSRQVGKSTNLSSETLGKSTAIDNYSTLYVAPRLDQVAEFSKAKLGSMIKGSPYMQRFVNGSVVQQARSKEFTNGSNITLRSCYLDADGIRGITANDIKIDELQDILLENIPVIEECSSRKVQRSITYAGTPKTFDNTIQKKWEETTQHYWAVKCTHCNHWNVPLGFENIGEEYLICSKCGKQIYAVTGQYVAMYPQRSFVGFHISQLMINGVPQTHLPWSRIIDKRDDPLYGTAKFYNECLGFSYDVGSKLLVASDVRPLCNPEESMSYDRKPEWGMTVLCAGVDWGVLGGNTRTVLSIGGMTRDGKFKVLFAKKFPVDQDPAVQVDEISYLINAAGCAVVCADRGNGHVANSLLRRNLRFSKVHEIEYKAKVSEGMVYNSKTKTWITDRTRAIAGIIVDIKTQVMEFCRYEDMDDFFADLYTLSCAYNDNLRAYQILRQNDVPDDFAHSLVYLRLAAKFIAMRPKSTKHALEMFSPDVGRSAMTDREAMNIEGYSNNTTSEAQDYEAFAATQKML